MPTLVRDPRVARTLTLAAGTWLLIDLIRAWSPTLITIFGQAASTPPELIGGFAIGCLTVPVLLVVLAARLIDGLLVVAVVARVALQLTSGGHLHLAIGSIGVIAAIAWLALALRRTVGAAVTGLVAGIALSVVTHAALGTWGAVWRRDGWAWLLLVLQIGLLIVGWLHRESDGRARRRGQEAPERGFGWLVMPGLFLVGMLVGNAGRASAVAGELGLTLISAGAVLAILATKVPVRQWSAALAGLVLIGFVVASFVMQNEGSTPVWVAVGYVIGLPALAHVWRAVEANSGTSPVAVTLGGVVWVLLLFAFYAGYDLGYRADWLVVAVAVAIAGVGLWRSAPVGGRPLGLTWIVPATLAAGAVAWGAPSLTIRPVNIAEAAPGTVTVATYNLRMGYGMDGRFQPRGVAEVLARSQVSLISEVDRGWYLNGGQDQLAILERLLDRDGWFGPAADQVWGDAVMIDATRVAVDHHQLPSHGAVTGAQALVLSSAEYGSITFVATHLQPADGDEGVTAQARDLAELLQGLAGGGGTVVVGGDFNMQEGSEAYEAFSLAGFVDAAPDGDPTSPADASTKRIDYVFLTPDAKALEVEVPIVQWSDHLPLLVRIQAPGL